MLHPHVEKRASGVEGYGLFAKQPIKKDEIVWKLDPDAQLLTLAEVAAGPPDYRRYAIQSRNRYFLSQDHIELMNHSCDPNTWYEGDFQRVAHRDIQPGEEITLDYSTIEVEPPYRFSWECRCGAPHCRKRITNDDCLDHGFQERYKGHLPSWTVEYIEHRNKNFPALDCNSSRIFTRRRFGSLHARGT